MKRILGIVGIVLLLLVVVLLVFTSQVVKHSINTVGPVVMGVPVSVESAHVFPLRGIVKLKNLVVGNPEGFKTASLFDMTELSIRYKPLSIFTDTIIVNEILVNAPKVTYESTLSGSNVGALEKSMGGKKEKDKEKPAEKEPGKKVIIERFLLTGGQVNLSLPGMMGTALPIPLPTIELKDIGKEKEGASLTDALGDIFGAIFAAVGNVVMASGKLIGDGAKLVGDGVVAAGGAVADGASAVGRGVADGASAVGRGVAGAVGGVLNVFSGSTNEDAAEKTESE